MQMVGQSKQEGHKYVSVQYNNATQIGFSESAALPFSTYGGEHASC